MTTLVGGGSQVFMGTTDFEFFSVESLMPTEREHEQTLKSLGTFTKNQCESSQSPDQSLFTLTLTR